MSETAVTKITSDDIRNALSSRFGAEASGGRTAILFEVANSTGFERSRSADAIVMWCWPSDGLELHGLEIKVSRSDWLRERVNPKKADDIAKFCDRWWLVTSPGVVREADELPPSWGWRVWDGSVLRVMKDAAVTPAEPVNRSFLGAVLRNAGRASEGTLNRARAEVREAIDEEVERRVQQQLRTRTPDKVAELITAVEAFEDATGIKLQETESWGWMRAADGGSIGRQLMALRASDFAGKSWATGSITNTLTQLDGAASALRDLARQFGIELPKPEPVKKRRRK